MGSPPDGAITCGGRPMLPVGGLGGAPTALAGGEATADGTMLGRRYRDPEGTVELLCVRQGRGSLALAGTSLELVKPRTMPATD